MKEVVKRSLFPGIEVCEMDDPVRGMNPVICIEAATIFGSDIHMYKDMSAYQTLSLPVIMGHEACGIIVDAGTSRLKVGQRVIIDSVIYLLRSVRILPDRKGKPVRTQKNGRTANQRCICTLCPAARTGDVPGSHRIPRGIRCVRGATGRCIA